MKPLTQCSWLRERLERYVENGLSDEEVVFLRGHIKNCQDCARLMEILHGNDVGLSESEGNSLTEGILDQTTGRGCERALSLYMYQIDEDITESDHELMSEHLRHCSACKEVLQTVNELFPVMRDMAELQPDPWFAADVIRRTRQLRWHERGLLARISDWWERFVSSPQLEIQTVYVGALVFSLTIGSSVPSIFESNELPKRFVDNAGTAVVEAFSPLEKWRDVVFTKMQEGWQNTGGRIIEYAESVSSEIRRRTDNAGPCLDSAEYHCGKMIDALEDGKILDGIVLLTETGYDLKSAITALFAGCDEEPAENTPHDEMHGSDSKISILNEQNHSNILWRVS